MKNSKFILFIVLPIVFLAAAIGFFGYSYFADGQMDSMSEGNLANAKTYRSGPFRVTVNINPEAPQVGNNQFTVKVDDASGNPVTGASIKAFGEMAAMATMSAMRAPADLEEVQPGLYAGPLKLEMRGEWPLSLYIQKDGVGETRMGFDMATGREGLSINSGGTPIANPMAGSSNGNMQGKGMAKGDGMMADGKAPKKNDLGFYSVGKYQIKVEVLGSGAMTRSDAMKGGSSAAMSKGSSGQDAMMGGAAMDGGNAMMPDKNMSASMTDKSGMMKDESMTQNMGKDDAMMQERSMEDGMQSDKNMMGSAMKGDDSMMQDAPKSTSMSDQMSGQMSDQMSKDTSKDMQGMKKGTAMMAGKNVLQVTVLDSNDQPVNGAKVRVAAQLETAKAMMQDDGMMQGDAMTDENSMMDSGMRAGDSMMQGKSMSAGKTNRMSQGKDRNGDMMQNRSMADNASMQNGAMKDSGRMVDPAKSGDAMMQDDNMPGSMSGSMSETMSQQDGMMDGQTMDGGMDHAMPGKRNSAVVQFESAGDGIYRGALMLAAEGDYVLAVDVSTEENGHGDLVLAFTTGEYGLRSASATPEGIAYYTCSMHTSVREAGPGQCPICSMDLVPVTNEQVQSGVVTIDARRRQLIGVETGKATLRDLTKTIRAVGQVDYDERQISNVSLKFDAWIGELKADYVGTQVEKGQVLFTVYSPELLSAQQEYLETRQRLASRGPNDSLVQASRRRLMLWDISPAQVRALERRGKALEYLPIYAPKSGTLVEKMVVEGSHMKTGDMLLRIADLSTVWIDAEVYEADLPLIKEGMNAIVTLPYLAQARYEATVDYVYPYLDSNTRTARIRLVLENPEGALKPDMYAEVTLRADLGRRLVVPEDAVLVAGESRVVFKDLGEDGKLKPVRVKTGQRVDGYIEITEGLSAGDSVITSGNFLIAAEAKLKTGIEQW